MPYLIIAARIALLCEAFRTFMRPQIVSDGAILLVSTMSGTECIGCDTVIGSDPPSPDDCEEITQAWIAKVGEYCTGGIVDPDSCFETVEGFICRMSAPGYMDATDWEYCETEADVLRWLESEFSESDGANELPYVTDRDIRDRLSFLHIHSEMFPLVRIAGNPSRVSCRDTCDKWTTQADIADAYIMINYATGSDYSGDTVTASNYKCLEEMESEYADDICLMSGGHGTYGGLVRLDCVPALWEIIAGLADYPCIDDEAVNETEAEWRQEALPDLISDTLREISNAFPDNGECLDACEYLSARIAGMVKEYCEGSEVEWHYEHCNAYAPPDKACKAIMGTIEFRTIIDDCYCDAIPCVPDGPVRYVVETESGTIVEENNTGETDHNTIISWVKFAYDASHHVRIYSAPCHPLEG